MTRSSRWFCAAALAAVHVGRSYRIPEFLAWTRGDIYVLIALGLVPVFLYESVGLKWLASPGQRLALLGTATAFIVGFKTSNLNRNWEMPADLGRHSGLQQRLGNHGRDFVKRPTRPGALIYRHLAWLTALRYHMRERRAWESVSKPQNASIKSSTD